MPRGSQALSVQSVASAQRASRSRLRYVQTATASSSRRRVTPVRRVEQLVPLDQELAHGDDRVAVAAGDRRPVRLALPELGAGGQAASLDPGALLDDDGVAGDGHAARGAADPLLPDHVGLGDGFAAVHPVPQAGERVPHAGGGERDDHDEAEQQPTAHAPLRHPHTVATITDLPYARAAVSPRFLGSEVLQRPSFGPNSAAHQRKRAVGDLLGQRDDRRGPDDALVTRRSGRSPVAGRRWSGPRSGRAGRWSR